MRRPKPKLSNSKSKKPWQIHVQIDEAFAGDVSPRPLREAARAALKQEGAAAGSLTIASATRQPYKR